MILIKRQSPRTRQPQYPLRLLPEFEESCLSLVLGSVPYRDLIQNASGVIAGTPSVEARSEGLGWSTTSSNYITLPDDFRTRITDQLTVLSSATIPTAGTGSLVANGAVSSNVYNWQFAGITGPKLAFYVRNTGATAVNAADTANFAAGTHRQVGTYDGANVGLWLRGRDPFFAAQTGNVQANDYTLNFSRVNFGGLTAVHHMAAVFNRVFSEAEIRAWHENPWQIFQPISRRIWVPSAGGGSYDVAGALGTATADGFTATVDRQLAIAATLGAATASGATATIDLQYAVSGTLGTATADGLTATVDRQLAVAGALGTATASGFDASISAGLTVNAELGTATADGFTAGVDLQYTVTATLAVATADGYQATIGTGLEVQATLGAAAAAGYTAAIDLQYEIAATLGAAAADGYTATISTSSAGTGATVEEIWAYEIEPGVSAKVALRRMLAALTGKVSGAGTDTEIFRDVNDTRDAITATVDASGNRTAITFNDGA